MTPAEQDIKIERIDQKVDSFKETVENFIQEMRDRDNRRDADIRELRERHDADIKELQKKHDALSARQDAVANELRTEIRDGIKNLQSLTIAAIVGIVAIAVAVIGFVFVVWQSIDQSIDKKIEQRIHCQQPAQTQNFAPTQDNIK